MTSPRWLDTDRYPFEPHFRQVQAFQFREPIAELRATHRCIAFLEKEPNRWRELLPAAEVAVVAALRG